MNGYLMTIFRLLCASALGLGCSSVEPESGSSFADEVPPPRDVKIVVDGVELLNAALVIDVTESPAGDVPSVAIVFFGSFDQANERTYWVQAWVTVEQLLDSTPLEVPVTVGPWESSGEAIINVGEEWATGGTVTIQFSADGPQLTGTVAATPDTFDATVSGTFTISCYPTEGGIEDGTGALQDVTFSSDFCAPLAKWGS